MRKAIGANGRQLIQQFIAEALFLMCAASIFAIIVAQFSLPFVNQLLDKNIIFDYLFTPEIIAVFASCVIITGLLTGIYPAWLTAKFQPATSLKSRTVAGNRSASFLRKGLVVTQFAVSGALLIALLLISQQMELFYNKNLGFDKDNIITLEIPDRQKGAIFADALSDIASVKGLTFASTAPSEEDHNGTSMHLTDLESADRKEVERMAQ